MAGPLVPDPTDCHAAPSHRAIPSSRGGSWSHQRYPPANNSPSMLARLQMLYTLSPPTDLHEVPSHAETPSTCPATSRPLWTVRALTEMSYPLPGPGSPSPSACQVLPSHAAMLTADTPPICRKYPAATRWSPYTTRELTPMYWLVLSSGPTIVHRLPVQR